MTCAVSRAARPALALSLQFALGGMAAAHRTVLPRHAVARWVRAALQLPAEITVRIVNTEEAQTLNRDFRGIDHATNVLTFDYCHAPIVQADLVLCADVVAAEALAQGLALPAHYAHLLVHGALHAQGHDHQTDEEAECMEALETQVLGTLGFADPYGSRPFEVTK